MLDPEVVRRKRGGEEPASEGLAPRISGAAPPFGLSPRQMKLIVAGLIGAFLILYFWRSVFIPIGSGHLGVLWSRLGGGTVTDKVYREGYRVIFPWDHMSVYDVRIQKMQDDVTVLTRDGLEVAIAIAARFTPRAAQLPTLHQKVGPDYRDKVVWPGVVSAARHVIRQYKPEDLQVLGEEKLSAEINAMVRTAIDPYWIDLDQVLITKIRLPERVQNAIQDKLTQEQKVLTYDFLLKQAELEKQKRSIEAEGIRQFEARSQVSFLKWRGLEVTEALAHSPNAKVFVLGAGGDQIPLLLNPDK
jgi:regulator of protease activity HflC (stomatin/prohibitin superfamily)